MKTFFIILFLIPLTVKAQDCIEKIAIWDITSKGIRPVSQKYPTPTFLWEDLSTKDICCFIRKDSTFTPVTQHPNKKGSKIRLKSALKKDDGKVVATIIIKHKLKEETPEKQQKRCKKNQIVMREPPTFFYLFDDKKAFP